MNVLYITYDGIAEPISHSQTLPYLEGLAKKDLRFCLLSFDKKGCFNALVRENWRNALAARGIRWFSLPYHKRPTALATGWDVACGFIVGLYIVSKEKIESIHVRSYVASLVGLGLKAVTRKKLIFDMRGYWADERVEGDIWPAGSRLYKLAKSWEKTFVRQADHIVVLTAAMKKQLARDYGLAEEAITVIPTCVDMDRFSIREGAALDLAYPHDIEKRLKDKQLLVYVGSLGTVYMLEEMFDFFRVLKEGLNNLHFLILTQSDKDIVYRTAAKKSVADQDFTVIDDDHQHVGRWLGLAKLGVAFYRPTFSAIGRAPTKIGEYLACGVPTVVNKGVGDIDRIISEERVGMVVNKFADQEYRRVSAQLQELWKQNGLRQRCRGVADEHFSLEKGIERYARIYQDLKQSTKGG